jgi:DNA mismatch repair protein MutS2
LRPLSDLKEAQRLQAETQEAFSLLITTPDFSIGGARDVREQVDLASHGGVLTPVDLLDVKSTLIAGRNLARRFERVGVAYLHLAELAAQMPLPVGLVDAISRAISDRGEVLDSASAKLAIIRRDLRVVHDRLLTKMQRMVSDSNIAQYLQEALVTQRDGRYVLPLRAWSTINPLQERLYLLNRSPLWSSTTNTGNCSCLNETKNGGFCKRCPRRSEHSAMRSQP